jgi:hypothetical protein
LLLLYGLPHAEGVRTHDSGDPVLWISGDPVRILDDIARA